MIKISSSPYSGRNIKRCLILLLASLLIIVLWGIVFKCNKNDELNLERNLSMSLWERFTFRLIPFQEVYLSLKHHRFWSNLASIFNVICFIPFGILLRFSVRGRTAVLLSLALSLGVEIFQLFSGFGGFDPTDLLLNGLGAYIGVILFNNLYHRIPERIVNTLLLSLVIPACIFAIAVTVRTVIYFPV